MKKIPYGTQYITDEDIQAILEVLKSENLTQGPRIPQFETSFSEYIGSKYAVAVINGTAALHLCAIVMNVKPGDKVITTPITFTATANCVRYCGGEVVFADIDPETYLLDINKVKELLTRSPKGTYKGIIPVDFGGYPVPLEEYRKLADEYGLWIIEDACHAPGGYFIDSKGHNQNCGNGIFAELAIFSFHPVKHITSGEGGMITTNDEKLYNRLRNLRTHGVQQIPELRQFNHGLWYYEMQELGFNYRLTDIQAALGNSQLKRADANLKRRKEIASIYNEVFSGNPDILNHIGLVKGHAYHLYVIEVNNRSKLYEKLRDKNIWAQVHYIPVHLSPYYRKFGWKDGDLPIAEKYYQHCLSLPMYPSLKEEEQRYVIESVLDLIRN
jgi:UDP-4-amino-4,6-dideoxy-N-acetyl-beta-L-altrosamine transaminase